MKKWLVGLVAAGLCAASVWAAGPALEEIPVSREGISKGDVSVADDPSGNQDGTFTLRLVNGGAYIARLSISNNGTLDEYYTDACCYGMQADFSQPTPFHTCYTVNLQIWWGLGWWDAATFYGACYEPYDPPGYSFNAEATIFNPNWSVGWLYDDIPSTPERTVTYTIESKTNATVSGTAPDGASATYAQTANNVGQITSNNTFKLTLKGYEGATITGLTLSMHSNGSKGAGSLSVTCGDAVIASIADAKFSSTNWNGSFTTSYVDIQPEVTPAVVDGDAEILITGSENSLYCQSVAVTYETSPAMFSISLVPSEDFEMAEGEDAVVVAAAKNAAGPVTYAWTVDGEPVEAEGNLLPLYKSAVGGPYEVVCTATDTGAEGATKEASVKYTVNPAPQTYTLTVAGGIENGSVAVWDGETELVSPADVLEKTTLKVVATPASRSYKVESITVTGEESGEIALENGEFVMPAENVFVTATFAERTQTVYSLVESMEDFEAGADYLIVAASGDYTSAMKNEYVSGSTGRISVDETISIVDGAVETEDDSIVWSIAAGAEGKYTLYNAAAGVYVSAPSSASINEALLVEDGTGDAAQWTVDIDTNSLVTIGSYQDGKSLQRNSNSSNKYFANYKGGTKPYLFKKVGTGGFSISLDPADDFDVPEGTEATITAAARNAQGEVTYTWNVTQDDTPGSAEGNVWTIPADAPAGGPWTVYCSATDGTSEADRSVSFSIVAAPAVYEVTIDENIENGTVTVDPASGVAGTEITVTASPAAGFALVTISVNGKPIEGNTFPLPEGGATVGATFEELPPRQGFAKITSLDELEEGEYVLVGSDGNGSYGAVAELTGSTAVLSAGTVTIQGDVVENPSDSQIWTLSKTDDGWTIYHEGFGYLGYTGSKNSAMAEEEASTNSTWTFSMADDLFKISNVGTEGRTLRYNYNSGSPRFACYASDTMKNIALYKNFGGAFFVTLDPAEDFEVVEGEAFSIEATPKNAAGEVTYVWTVDGVPAETDGNLLSLVAGEASETLHEVVCVATDGGAEEGAEPEEASVRYTVVAAPVPYTVTIAEGIENGTVALNLDGFPIETPINLLEGTEVTVEATPDDGYELEAITVNGGPIGGNTFVVRGDSEVSATFTEVVDYATLPFLAEDTPFTGQWKNSKEPGVTSEGLDTDYSDGAAKLIANDTWVQIKFQGTPGELVYTLKGNGTTEDCVFEVRESATGAEGDWTPLATFTGENALPTAKATFTNELSAGSRFVRFVYVNKDKGNVALYDVYISAGGFSVGVDKNGFVLGQGTTDTVTAAAKNGTEPYTYVWTSETEALNGEGAELAIPDTLEPGEYAVTVTATDSSGEPQTATVDVTFTVAAKYPVSIDVGILNGNVEADVPEAAEGDTVTLTATPDPGYKLGAITVSYGEETLEFTTSPAIFEMPASEVYVGASFVESHDEIFVPVESEAEFVVGEEYLIVAHKEGSFTDALKNAANGTRIGVDAVTIEADGYVKTDNADIVWKILAGEEEGQYVLFNEAASVYAAATRNDNVAQLLEDGTDPLAQWTLDLSALPAVKIVSVSYANRCLQRNNSTAYFATYTGTQTTPMLFKKASSLEFAVNVDKTGFELALGEGTTVTATARYGVGDVTYVWTSETGALNGEGPELAIPDTLAEGAYSATVTATDSSTEPQTATAEVTFTVVAPAVTYPVNVVIGILHGSVTADRTEASPGDTVTLTANPEDGWKLGTFLVNGEEIPGDSFVMPESEVLVSAEFVEIVKYPVTIAIGILNGSVTADKEEAEAGELVTLTADPDDGWQLDTFLVNGEEIGGNTFEMPEGEALVSAKFVETVLVTFVPVESAADLVAGGEYLVVAHKDDGFTSALKNENSGTRIGVDEVEIAANGSIAIDNDAIVWEIRAGAEEGEYVLYNASAGVYAAALSDGNTAQVLSDGTDPLAQWTIDLAEAPAVKIASAAYPSRWLQRNSTPNNKFFAAYTGSQTTPALYKKAGFSVGFDKEDGFTVEAGTADSITATALRGTEPYSYTWTGDLEGDGATLAIPDDLAEGEYSVKVTTSDSSKPPQTAEREISFTVVPPTVRYAVTVAEGIVGGEVAVDKELAEAGETVTVTATPASGYELVTITLDGEPIEGNTFEMPAQDVVVSATFDVVVDYAVLPFVAPETPYSGPWKDAEVAGLTHDGLDSDYTTGGVRGAKFRTTGAWMQIKFRGTPGTLSFGIKGNGTSATNVSTFVVLESADGGTWTPVAVFTSDENLTNARQDVRFTLSEDSRYVQFLYQEKGDGNVGIYDVYIGEAGEPEPSVTVTGDTTLTLGGTFELALALENYSGEYAWAWEPEIVGYVDPDTATFWWTPTVVGETTVTFSAVDGTRTIASETVTLTVAGEPALVFDGDDEGTVGTPVSFTVVAEYVADPTVTFLGFLDVPEGSGLTDADVVLDFPNVTFTPDVAGDYGLAFSAGTAGVDYVEDVWIVTVNDPEVVFDGDDSGTTGTAVKFKVSADIPGGSVDFENFLYHFPEGSSLTEDDVTIDTATGEVSFTPDVPGDYEFGFTLVGGQELYVWTVTVEGEDPPAELPEITDMLIDTDEGTILLVFKGTGVSVWGTSDLTDPTSWDAVEDAVIEGNTATVPMGTPFLRVQ